MPESSFRDEKIEEMLTTLPAFRAAKLSQAVASLDNLTLEKQSLAAQGSELYKSWTAEETAARERQVSERNSKVTAAFESEVKEWANAGLTQEEIATARSIYSGQGNTFQDASRAALWAVTGQRAVKQLQELSQRNQELEQELGKLRKAQPGVGAAAGGAIPASDDLEDDPNVVSYAERVARQHLRAGGTFGAR
jgi:hypothetical protein